LRALENRVIERLGGTQSIPVDVRVISATHRDLPAHIAAGKFREDLYYRLHVVTLEVQPLRARKEDIPLLASAFVKLHSANMARGAHEGRTRNIARVSHDAMDALMHYDWPGNVRELKNALERSIVFAKGQEIKREDLPAEITTGDGGISRAKRAGAEDDSISEPDYRDAKRKFEVAYITRQLERHKWNVSRTAATIGLHRQSLQEKLRELGILRPGRAAEDDAAEE